MTVQEALSSQQALQEFGTRDFSIQASLIVAANQRLLTEVCKEYDVRRIEVVKKYGEEDSETGQTTVTPSNQFKFSGEVNKLLMEEVDIKLKTLSISDLGGSEFKIPPNLIVHLYWMIKQ